ncbi:hypothetical protein OROHE_019579 [Orobanche hederae]
MCIQFTEYQQGNSQRSGSLLFNFSFSPYLYHRKWSRASSSRDIST